MRPIFIALPRSAIVIAIERRRMTTSINHNQLFITVRPKEVDYREYV
jgi:hypothetical protein